MKYFFLLIDYSIPILMILSYPWWKKNSEWQYQSLFRNANFFVHEKQRKLEESKFVMRDIFFESGHRFIDFYFFPEICQNRTHGMEFSHHCICRYH